MLLITGLVLLFVLWLERRPLRSGVIFLTTVLGYSVVRFALTPFRQEAVAIWGLQQAQVVALATAAAALILLFWLLQPRGQRAAASA